MSGENVERSLQEHMREAADRMEDGHYVQAPPMLRHAADTIDALRAENERLAVLAYAIRGDVAARDATIESLRAALAAHDRDVAAWLVAAEETQSEAHPEFPASWGDAAEWIGDGSWRTIDPCGGDEAWDAARAALLEGETDGSK